MNRWIAAKNVDDFRRKLANEKDPDRRRILAELLASEEQKLREPDTDEEARRVSDD
ncbi:MAG TPA: hypothetical protein VJR47_05025 [Stellaceae bacterium]|nr:hypothetical protein [Stellaceae bacterium]